MPVSAVDPNQTNNTYTHTFLDTGATIGPTYSLWPADRRSRCYGETTTTPQDAPAQVGLHKDEQVDQQPVHVRPPLVLLHQQQLGHEGAVRHELQPREGEAGAHRRLQRVERRREGRQHLQPNQTNKRRLGGGGGSSHVLHALAVEPPTTIRVEGDSKEELVVEVVDSGRVSRLFHSGWRVQVRMAGDQQQTTAS